MNDSLITLLDILNKMLAWALIVGGAFAAHIFLPIGEMGYAIGILVGAAVAGIVCGLIATLIRIENHLRLIASRTPSPPLKF